MLAKNVLIEIQGKEYDSRVLYNYTPLQKPITGKDPLECNEGVDEIYEIEEVILYMRGKAIVLTEDFVNELAEDLIRQIKEL